MQSHTPFHNIFKDPQPFNFKGINTAKYFYDLHVTRSTLGSFDTASTLARTRHSFLKKPLLAISGFIKYLRLVAFSRGRILFFNNENRVLQIGERVVDLYNSNILRDIGPSHALVIQERHDTVSGKVFPPALVMDDLTPLLFLFEKLLSIIYKVDIRSFLAIAGSSLEGAGFSRQETESRLVKFYARYLFYRAFLKTIRPQSAILICHYSKHAFMAACKCAGIQTLELQHGHILPTHRYYHTYGISKEMLNAFRKYFVPDFIFVYGRYWKELLIKGGLFTPEQIIILGYFQKVQQDLGEHPVQMIDILITTSPQLQQDFIDYVNSIMPIVVRNDIRIAIKPHPSEQDTAYQTIVDNDHIWIDHHSIHLLMPLAKAHISIASSTLFDALLYDLNNYILVKEGYSSFQNEVIEMGVANRLNLGKMPNLIQNHASGREKILEAYDYNRIKDIVGV